MHRNPCILPAMNIVLIAIKKGNLPLQGTKLLVKMEINLSRGESIILHPTQPCSITTKSHAHSNHLFTRATTFFKKTIHIKSNSRKVA